MPASLKKFAGGRLAGIGYCNAAVAVRDGTMTGR
jgi:hypothetical protein